MLAYSAIAHAGYILVGMTAVASPRAGGAILYYLLGYAFTNLGAFAVVIALERRGAAHDNIADYRGLATRHPLLAAAMAIFMLSLTGVPPLAGFVGKFYIFSAALDAHLRLADDHRRHQQRHLGLLLSVGADRDVRARGRR